MVEQIKQIANKCTKQKLLNIIYSLSELANDLKMTTQKTIMLEVGIMKLCSIKDTNDNVQVRNNATMQNIFCGEQALKVRCLRSEAFVFAVSRASKLCAVRLRP